MMPIYDIQVLHEVKEYLLGSATDNTEALNMLVSNFETLISAYGIEEEDLNDHLEDHKMMKLSRENKLVRSKRHIEIIQYDRVLIQHECHMWLKNFITMAMLPKQLLLDVFDLRSVERSKIAGLNINEKAYRLSITWAFFMSLFQCISLFRGPHSCSRISSKIIDQGCSRGALHYHGQATGMLRNQGRRHQQPTGQRSVC